MRTSDHIHIAPLHLCATMLFQTLLTVTSASASRSPSFHHLILSHIVELHAITHVVIRA